MFLKKFIYVNWGNIPASEFEFGPVNLLSGGNGSGKTTAADAIQTVMTAAHDTLFNYNPGQDEASQRGRGKHVRTLASYVLGCDDGSYARPEGATGYLAAVFHPTQQETGEPFTAVIGVSALLDKAGNQPVARQQDLRFFIIAGEMLTLSDLLQQDLSGDRMVVPLKQLKRHLQGRVESLNVEQYDTKKQYLRRLYAALRGRHDAVTEREAMNAARTFSRFMAYKPVKSIHQFVANEILEPRDLGDAVRSVSDLMKTLCAMEADANTLAASVERLKQLRAGADDYQQHRLDCQLGEFQLAHSRATIQQRSYLDARKQREQHQRAVADTEQQRQSRERERQQLRDQLVAMEARRLGISALQDKDKAETECADAQSRREQAAIALLKQHQAATASGAALEEAETLLANPDIQSMLVSAQSKDWLASVRRSADQEDSEVAAAQAGMAVLESLSEQLTREQPDFTSLSGSLTGVRAHEQRLNQVRQIWLHGAEGDSLLTAVQATLHLRQQRKQQLEQKIRQRQQDVRSLEDARITYPGYVVQALDAIREALPDAEPGVLADFVDVKDPEWQSAVEGYIGGARFSILVNPEYEADAARIVRQLPGGRSRARVIQGEKARRDGERQRLPDNSIMHLLEFEHATARAYLQASYGAVEQVSDVEQLRKTRRGLTSDGLGSGAYSIYRCDLDDAELVFGIEARQRSLVARQQELEQWQQTLDSDQKLTERLQRLQQALVRMQPLELASAVEDLLQTQQALNAAQSRLQAVDTLETTELDLAYQALQQQMDAVDQSLRELDARLGQLGQQLKDSERLCSGLSQQRDDTLAQAERSEDSLQQLVDELGDTLLLHGKRIDLDDVLDQARTDAEAATPEQLQQTLATTRQRLNGLAHALERQVSDHNLVCQNLDAIVYAPDYSQEHNPAFFTAVCDLQTEAGRIYNRLKNNLLVEKRQQLSELRDSFNNAFVTNLCHAIYQAINEGKRVLEDLNAELQHHRFGADQERYWFDWGWVPEYRDYWLFFEEVIKNPSLGEGSTLFDDDFDASLPKKALQVRDRLMDMLLDEDEQKAMRELERITDYRNYRRYEIYRQPANKEAMPLSEYGTGSGGQLETPAYIIRSAAITSAFRFNEGDSHLRMVLVDEAFSKMDEVRSREVINYLTDTLGLQLLFVMPTSKSGPFMDLISNQFVFAKVPAPAGYRVGELQTRVLVDRQQCNQERVRELWANHRRTIRHQAGLDFMAEFS